MLKSDGGDGACGCVDVERDGRGRGAELIMAAGCWQGCEGGDVES